METKEENENHKLRNYYRFWRMVTSEDAKSNYMNNLQDLGLCQSVEEFWQIYTFLPIIGSERAKNYYFFRNYIKPMWEDEQNCRGGRTVVTVSDMEYVPYMWETLLLATIGEQFDVGNEICGISVSVKNGSATFMVWNRTSTNDGAITRIFMKLKAAWNAPQHVSFSYKLNHDAVEKVEKHNMPVDKKEAENMLLKKQSTNRFAALSDEEADSE